MQRRKKTADGDVIAHRRKGLKKWRRRESNLRAISTQLKTANAVAKTANSAALHMRCTWSASKVVCWHRLTLNCSAS
jgi:hypothetical protein